MTMNKNIISKKSATKLVLSFSTLLLLSACSADKTAEDTVPVDAVETTVVEAEKPVVVEPTEETAAVAEAPAENVAVVDADTNGAAEPEILAANAGEELYNKQCMACHSNGLLNAPKLGDKEAWAPRIAKGKETLYTHSAQGFNKMPAQAVNGITEAQVKASVDYMLAAVS